MTSIFPKNWLKIFGKHHDLVDLSLGQLLLVKKSLAKFSVGQILTWSTSYLVNLPPPLSQSVSQSVIVRMWPECSQNIVRMWS